MKGIKYSFVLMAACLLLAGCGKTEDGVFVQSVASLSSLGGIAPGDRFGGLVVSENVTEIQKDNDKTVESLLVREGDDVKKGQALFSYDVDELQLALDKQELQLEQLKATIDNCKVQIAELQRQKNRSSGRDLLEYTIQIQTVQVEQKEAELNLKNKEKEVEKSRDMLQNSTVTAPVDGRIQSINESGSSDLTNQKNAYITIQQTGSYRVKGTLNELQRGGIMEGDRIRMVSRTDSSAFWLGTVTLVDYENPSQGNSNNMYGGESDDMGNSSRYPFYVDLDSTEGLILGQHLYLSIDAGEDASSGLSIDGTFVCFDDNGRAYVWAENGRHKLEKRSVELGDYQDMRGTYEILSGLTEADYIAFPDEEVCHPGAATTRVESQTEGGM